MAHTCYVATVKKETPLPAATGKAPPEETARNLLVSQSLIFLAIAGKAGEGAARIDQGMSLEDEGYRYSNILRETQEYILKHLRAAPPLHSKGPQWNYTGFEGYFYGSGGRLTRFLHHIRKNN